MKLFAVFGRMPYEGETFYGVRATRAEAEALQRQHHDVYQDVEIRLIYVDGIVSSAEATRMAGEAAKIAHDQVIAAWDRERDLRSVPG